MHVTHTHTHTHAHMHTYTHTRTNAQKLYNTLSQHKAPTACISPRVCSCVALLGCDDEKPCLK